MATGSTGPVTGSSSASELAPVRVSELAESVDLDLSTVSRQVRDLVAGGLVDKAPDPDDGRASLLSLTAYGAAVLEAVSEGRREVLAEAIADWTDEERDELARSLLRLNAGLSSPRANREATGAEAHNPPTRPAPSAGPTGNPSRGRSR